MKDSLPALLVFGTIVALVIVTQKDNLTKQAKASSQLRQQGQQAEIAAAAADLRRMSLEQALTDKQTAQPLEAANAQEGNKIATGRYLSNCRSPRAADGQGIAIAPGMSLNDPLTGFFIPDNTPVCDSSGNTGIMLNGVVIQFARLTDSPKRVLPKETFETYFKAVPAAKISRGSL
ncbi:MAG: hypothetical protein KME45_03210 [Stenomitos rutilans HA7619-LM2]|jgi:hypothetical protein|nr:hypothetical protein [Stenomitos rutilans HA7619-LM2]MBW4469394.1 hypothetical protein [Stenomitos rutilans HA7619-LM2]